MEKRIITGVTLDDRTFVPGDEDDLAKVATTDQLRTLSEAGAISGFGHPDREDPDAASRKKYGTAGQKGVERRSESEVSRASDRAQSDAEKTAAKDKERAQTAKTSKGTKKSARASRPKKGR